MTSIFQGIFEESVGPAASELFGETVTQWPLGIEANAATVEGAIWNELESLPISGNQQEVERKGRLFVPDATIVNQKDKWIVRGEEWQTESWDRDQGGNKRLHLKRQEQNRRWGTSALKGGNG